MSTAAYQLHILVIQDDQGSHEITLGNPKYTIGRDPNCDIRLTSQFVSRRHATLVQLSNDDGTYYYRIVDGMPAGRRSSNGLRINGHKLSAHDLQHEDLIVFGTHVSARYLSLKQELILPSPLGAFDTTLIGAKTKITSDIKSSKETLFDV